MNTITATGWLQKDATATYIPGIGTKIVVFEIYLANEETANAPTAPWRCEVENLGIIQRCETKLVAGAGVMLRGELMSRPYTERGIQKGWVRYLKIDRLEFSRVPVSAQHAAEVAARAEPA